MLIRVNTSLKMLLIRLCDPHWAPHPPCSTLRIPRPLRTRPAHRAALGPYALRRLTSHLALCKNFASMRHHNGITCVSRCPLVVCIMSSGVRENTMHILRGVCVCVMRPQRWGLGTQAVFEISRYLSGISHFSIRFPEVHWETGKWKSHFH